MELRFLVGLNEQEAARVLEVSVTTVKREWKWDRAWLFDQMRNR